MKALVIFSGGQDSTTCLGWSKNRYETEAVSFHYGQNHANEIEQARLIAGLLNIKHHIIDIGFFGKMVDSALTSHGDVNQKHPQHDLPASFVPNRNALFITLAHALAQTIKANKLITGVCETDFSGYPDCRNTFIKSINAALNIGSDTNIDILTPLMFLNKSQTWEMAEQEGVLKLVRDYSLTCYNGSKQKNEWGFGCGECPACRLRKKGYDEFLYQKKNGNSRVPLPEVGL